MKQFLKPADILLPKKDFSKWSVIACDQYTSEPEYWQETEKTVGDTPSALRIVLPEVYLEGDNSERVNKINRTMQDYLQGDVFATFEDTTVLTLRHLKNGKVRTGIVGLIDLEDYSYEKGADTLIRATEETVVERIPPRVAIRKDAPIEIPHVMLLIDDKRGSVVEKTAENAADYQKLYDFTLMQNAGRLEGYKIPQATVNAINSALGELAQEGNGLLFAVGDGNHSLATAKECYKSCGGSRYALVEVVNIHDPSLEFEPIYRVAFGVNPEEFIKEFKASLGESCDRGHKFTLCYGEREETVCLKANAKLAVADLQCFLDGYIARHSEVKIDYIHGTENTRRLASNPNCVGFLFEGMGKSDLFPAVVADGSLPRKTFSMGCADDKRFYLEARKIK